ncbi:MAG TPA: HD domain-containing phosphohydrolase [Candidatus Elarobacter sp.]|nr:HD domain-containing phosphohydrolase [Candidatus Elarobacter sp.]
MTVPVDLAGGALGLYGAVGDAFAGRRLGFGRRRASVAAGFARHRGRDDQAVAANWFAALLADAGLIAIALPPEAGPQHRSLAYADAPLHGARIAATFENAPPHAADIVRWHREHDDGTGIPDRLRWDGIPADAAALGIVDAFLAAIEDPEQPREALEALLALEPDSGRRFGVERLRAFREFVHAGNWDEPHAVELPPVDDDAALRALAARIDARDTKTAGRSERLAAMGRALAARLDLDPNQTTRLAHLLALSRATEPVPHDDFDPFSRFARGHRDALAQRAAAIAGSVAAYAADAPHLAASAGWYEDGDAQPLAGLLGLLLAVDALDPVDAPRRLAAASGTQFAPETTRAYLTLLSDGR